jgi:hypothetical protein
LRRKRTVSGGEIKSGFAAFDCRALEFEALVAEDFEELNIAKSAA